jgi:heme iron utilization protein
MYPSRASAPVSPLAFASALSLSRLSAFGVPSPEVITKSPTPLRTARLPRRSRPPSCAPTSTPVASAEKPTAAAEHRLTAGERARTIVTVCRGATLCTSSAKHEGVPFGSHVDYVLDPEGRPVFLLAAAAAHTKNIAGAPSVSLYCQPPKSSGQAGGRVTLVGDITLLDDAEALADVKDEYILAHAHAADALEYPDLFAFYRMSVHDVYFVGGFGVVAQWVDASDFAGANPDPLAFDAAEIVSEINSARGEELTRLCEVYLGLGGEEAGGHFSCKMTSLDRLGFDVRVRTDAGATIREYRVAFRESVNNRFDCQSALVKAFQEAWERQNGMADAWLTEEARPTVMYYSLT